MLSSSAMSFIRVLIASLLLSTVSFAPSPSSTSPEPETRSNDFTTAEANVPVLLPSTTTTTSTTHPPPPPTTTTTERPEPAPAAVSAPPSAPEPPAPAGECGGYQGLVAAYWPANQVAKACAVIGCETGYTYSPTAENPSSSASGLFQFLDGTWQNARQYVEGASQYARASHAPAETQIAVGAAWWSRTSWDQWECA